MLAVVGYHQHDIPGCQYPIEGVLHKTHCNLVYHGGFAEVDDGVDAVAPVSLPMAVGIGGVAAKLPVDEGIVAAAAVDGLIGAVLRVELYLGAHTKVGEEVLLGDHALAVFIVGNGLDGGGTLEREGTGVEDGALVWLGAVEGVIDRTVVIESAERNHWESVLCSTLSALRFDEDVSVEFQHLAGKVVVAVADDMAFIVAVWR